jgi:hypothetical protein
MQPVGGPPAALSWIAETVLGALGAEAAALQLSVAASPATVPRLNAPASGRCGIRLARRSAFSVVVRIIRRGRSAAGQAAPRVRRWAWVGGSHLAARGRG